MPFQWIEVIIGNRPHYDEDVTDLTVNDVRNGMLVNLSNHRSLELRQTAFLKVVIIALY